MVSYGASTYGAGGYGLAEGWASPATVGFQVLLDDGTGTFPFDITASTRVQMTVSRGRQDELSQVSPGQLTLTLDNTDGRFTPGSTIIASPSPIKANARIRVKETANATTVTRFTGYVQAWPVAWPSGGQTLSEVTILATDAQARAERRVLRSVIEEEILLDDPAAYCTLGEPAGAIAAGDTSGNQRATLAQAGEGADVVFGNATGPGTDGLTAAQFAGGQYLTTLLSTGPAALECWFSTATTPGAPVTILSAGGASRGGLSAIVVDTDGKLHTATGDLSGPVVTDGLTHHLVWMSGHVYLDDVDIGSPTAAPSGAWGQVCVGGGGLYGASDPAATPTAAFNGAIAHVAAYAVAPSSTRVTAHKGAGSSGFAGESGTARLTRLAGYGSLPVGTLDTSLTNVAFSDFTGQPLAQALRDVADAEFGLVFIDGSGNLTFHNRNRATVKTAPDITIDLDALDPSTAFQYDTQGVVNYFEATTKGTGVTQVARDSTSEAQHGRYPNSSTYLVQTDAEALDRANWIVATRADPSPRLGSLTVDLLTQAATTQAALLAAEPNTWIRVTGLPSQTPGGTTADLVVQGFSEQLTKDAWLITFNVSAKSLTDCLILDDPTRGVLDAGYRLYV